MKIKGFYGFKVVTGKLILTANDEWWQRRDWINNWENQSYSLDFSLKSWIYSGDQIIQSIPENKVEYKDLIIDNNIRTDYYKPPIIIGLSSKNAVVVQTWTGNSDTELSAVLLDINGGQITSRGYVKLGGIPYPVIAGRINDKTAFLLDSQGGRILSIEDDGLKVYNKSLNLPLISYGNNMGGWSASYLNKDAILIFNQTADYLKVQLIKISEEFEFTSYPAVEIGSSVDGQFIVNYELNSTRLSNNKCFIAYGTQRYSDPSSYRLSKTGRIITVNNEAIEWGDETDLISRHSSEGFDYYPQPGIHLSSIPNQDVIIAFYQAEEPVEFGVEPKSRLMVQAIKINDLTSISPKEFINIEDVEGLVNSSLVQIGAIPISSDTFLCPILHQSSPLNYRFVKISGNNITVSNRYYPAQDSDFFELAARGFDNNKSFGSTALIPPLI